MFQSAMYGDLENGVAAWRAASAPGRAQCEAPGAFRREIKALLTKWGSEMSAFSGGSDVDATKRYWPAPVGVDATSAA
jgi:hypothetical protein